MLLFEGGAAEFIDSSGKVVATSRPPTKNEQIQEALIDQSVFIHPTTVFRRDVFIALGGTDASCTPRTMTYGFDLPSARK